MTGPTVPASDQRQTLLDQLRRVLEHEKRRGCADNAVVGGLAGFLDPWVSRWPAAEQGRAAALVAALRAYRDQPSTARQQAIEMTLRLAANNELPQPIATLDPPASSERPPARVLAPSSPAPTVPLARNRPEEGAPSSDDQRSAPKPPRRAAVRPAPPRDPALATDSADPLSAAVETLRGVGPSYSERFHHLGIATIRDLLYHFPRRHLDYRSARLIRDLTFEDYETILATVWRVKVEPKPGGLLVIRAILADESGTAEAVWLRRKDYVSKELVTGRSIVLSGECRLVGGRPVFRDPEWESMAGEDTVHTARLVPVYPLVEGLSGRYLRRIAKQAVDRYAAQVPDPLPPSLCLDYHLLDLSSAIAQAHFPDTIELKAAAQRRLAFEELLVVQLGVLARRRSRESGETAPSLESGSAEVAGFLASLPFQLTAAQKRALDVVLAGIQAPRPMSLLLEGDVGSGKTVVATAAMVQVRANNFQSAIMAPTEILADQHARTIERLLAPLGEKTPRITLLTGSVKGAERRKRYQAIKAGEVDIIVGTQALVQEGLEFARLGLVVIDEQHRFGVTQRGTLRQKGYNPHVLVMTATPIPRTLALTLYGDMDLTVIDELPPGRQTIKTRYLRPTERPKAYEFLRREVKGGHQAFIICPLVEESERSDARAATAEHARLQEEVFPDLRLGLLHGRMKPAEKDEGMRRFQEGEFDVLVSTAVVEVGIDVPNATVMLIEGANRFGLAQLHQFRGRVGRGSAQSYCLLISDTPSDATDRRLSVVETTHDGFKLAEEDLRLRGPGEFFGTRQSGLPDLKTARWGDALVLEQARGAATEIFRVDPHMTNAEHRLLRQMVEQFWQRDAITLA